MFKNCSICVVAEFTWSLAQHLNREKSQKLAIAENMISSVGRSMVLQPQDVQS